MGEGEAAVFVRVSRNCTGVLPQHTAERGHHPFEGSTCRSDTVLFPQTLQHLVGSEVLRVRLTCLSYVFGVGFK